MALKAEVLSISSSCFLFKVRCCDINLLSVLVFQLLSVPFLSLFHAEDKAECTLMATSKR